MKSSGIFFLLLVFAFSACCFTSSDVRHIDSTAQPCLSRTYRLDDICLLGRGYFLVVDDADRRRVVRSGRIVVDSLNRLCLKAGGSNFTFFPEVIVPAEHSLIIVEPDGSVLVRTYEGSELSEYGTIEIVGVNEQEIDKREGVVGVLAPSAMPTSYSLSRQDRFIATGWANLNNEY
jgi:flagellar basal body rod protein FlgG